MSNALTAPIEEINPTIVYKQAGGWQKEIDRKHAEHMERRDQEGWLEDLFNRVDEMSTAPTPEVATPKKKASAKRGKK